MAKLLRKDLAEIKTPFISDSLYEALRNNVEVVLPAIGVFYFTIASILHWPFGDEVNGIINALVLLLGIIIKVNRGRNTAVTALNEQVRLAKQADNQAGDLVVNTGDQASGLVTVRLDKEPSELAGLEEVRFKVIDAGMGTGLEESK